jgi:uncharacterized glyoxalase superfamily protein PhnB
MTDTKTVLPQRLFAVTIGSGDIERLRSFYETWGWRQAPFSTDEYAAFEMGGAFVSFFSRERLGAEAAPGEQAAATGWNGITLAVNLDTREDVDASWQSAVAAGAVAVGRPEDRPWGGRSGYVADPEGNRWEIAWVPPMPGA